MSWTFGYNNMPYWIERCEECGIRIQREFLKWYGLRKLCPKCAPGLKVIIITEKKDESKD